MNKRRRPAKLNPPIAGTPSDKRHNNSGRAGVMNIQITTAENNVEYVQWTCPKKLDNGKPCLQRNNQRWYGRDDHICIRCGQSTNIKGETKARTKAGTLA